MATYQLNVKINGVEQAVSSIGEVEKALKATREELKGVELGSEAFEELSLQARMLQDEFKDGYKEATNFDLSLAKLTESVSRLGSSAAAGFLIATTAMEMFGTESEDLTKAQVEAQKALALALSISTIATNAAKAAGDVKLITDKLSVGVTNLLTGAIGKETIAKAAQAVATGTATAAQAALNAVMMANPVMLLVGAIAALAAAYLLFSKNTEKAISYQRDFNEEMQQSRKVIEEEIKLQQKLIGLQTQLLESAAESETEKLQIRIKSQKELDILDKKALEAKKEGLEDELDAFKMSADAQVVYLRMIYDQQQTMGETQLKQDLNYYEQKQMQTIAAYDQGIIDADEYYKRLFELEAQYITFTEEEQATEYRNRKKQRDELLTQVEILGKEIENLDKEQAIEAEIQRKELERAQREAYKRQIEETNRYNELIARLTEDRVKNITDLERELEDFYIDKISKRTEYIDLATGKVVKDYEKMSDADKANLNVIISNTEDMIREYDERIEKLRIANDRQIFDNRKAFEEELKDFKKDGEEKIKAGVINREKFNSDLVALEEKFNEEELRRGEVFNEKLIALEQEKASKIIEIDNILKNELVFGDNDLSDGRTQLELDSIDFQIEMSNRRIAIEQAGNLQSIISRQKLEKDKLKLLRDSQLEANKIEFEEGIKLVQGSEEQKQLQRERLIRKYNEDNAKINEDFRLQEEELEKKSMDEIYQYKYNKLTQIMDLASNGLSEFMNLASSIVEIGNNEITNSLNNLRDELAIQTDELNIAYNTDLDNLKKRYELGLISKEEYNNAVIKLDEKLDKSTEALTKKAEKREDALKKQAFEREKKLKIASAIVSGIQGASQAFANAFSNPAWVASGTAPIIGAAFAALVTATTAAQVAAIAKTQYDYGAPDITPISSSSISLPGGSNNGDILNNVSGGGYTEFSQDLVNDNVGGGNNERNAPIQVYILESDIRRVSNRVSVLEGSATIG